MHFLFLGLCVHVVSIFFFCSQLLFDFLAFKNDISFWKQKKSMVGMSSKAGRWFLCTPVRKPQREQLQVSVYELNRMYLSGSDKPFLGKKKNRVKQVT